MFRRVTVDPTDIRIPDCGYPRPGERVIWYQGRARYEGTLVGHCPGGRPYIANDFGTHSQAASFKEVRLADPFRRGQPNWFRLPSRAIMLRPTDAERTAFRDLLEQRIPPGPKYADAIREIWSRGYETYLVGGTVRDVVSGDHAHDVDLVTTMPVDLSLPLMKQMYGDGVTASEQNGYIRMGGHPKSGDPFIDLSVFKRQGIGSREDVVFSDDFDFDVANRDFACNSVYYDPINEVLIDPTGRGLADAQSRQLSLVSRADLRNAHQLAQIGIRFVKFRCRGYTATAECLDGVLEFGTFISAMKVTARANYIRTQVLSKSPTSQHAERFGEFRGEYRAVFGSSNYASLIEPHEETILR